MTINFYLDSKLSDNNEKAIMCFVRGIAPQKTIYLRTELKINPDLWNPKKQCVRKNHSNFAELNQYLIKMKEEIQAIYVRFISENAMDFIEFKKFLKKELFAPQQKDKPDFFKVFHLFLEAKKTNLAPRTIEAYVTFHNNLKKFELAKDWKLSFDNINIGFYDEFIDFSLNVAKLTNNSVLKRLKQLKSFMNWAYERNYHQNSAFKKFKYKGEEIEVVALTKEELFTIYNLDLSDNARMEMARDYFCLCCFTGQRFSELKKFDMKDIIGNTWYLRTRKSKDIIQLPLNDYALEIIEKYRTGGKIFPQYSRPQELNKYTRKIGKLAGIDEQMKIVRYRGAERIDITTPKYEKITSHVGRRTFTTLSLQQGMRPEVVMAITGHSDYKTFKRYIHISSNAMREEMQMAWKK